jgi:hypothetical protein
VKRNAREKKRGEKKEKESSRRQGKTPDVRTTFPTTGDVVEVTDRYRPTLER